MIIQAIAILIAIYLLVGEPLVRRWCFRVQMASMQQDPVKAKRIHYWQNIIRYTIIAMVIVGIYELGYTIGKLGFTAPSLTVYAQHSLAFKIFFVAIAILYVGYYYVFVMLLPHFSKTIRALVVAKTAGVKYIAPVSTSDKVLWFFYSLTNGASEELMYRAFLISFLIFYIPHISVTLLILITALLDAIRYVRRRFVFMNVFFSAVFYVTLYLALGSIYLPIIMHILNYIKVYVMPLPSDDELKKHSATKRNIG